MCEELIKLLDAENAHVSWEKAIVDIPVEFINSRIDNVPYSLWEVFEHTRICQLDILDFIVNPDYKYKNWPEDYWAPKEHVANESDWSETANGFFRDLNELKNIVGDSEVDLTASLEHAPKYTVFREVVLVADHNAYHLGSFIAIKRGLGLIAD